MRKAAPTAIVALVALAGCASNTPTANHTAGTTTVPPAATTTTTGVSQIGNGPLVVSCSGAAPQFEPSTITVGCATGHDGVGQLVWSDWNEAVGGGPRQADGTGVFNWDNCVPNCAQGQESSQQVTITLSNPVSDDGTQVWGTMELDTGAGDLPGWLSTPSETGNVSQLLFPLASFGAA